MLPKQFCEQLITGRNEDVAKREWADCGKTVVTAEKQTTSQKRGRVGSVGHNKTLRSTRDSS